MTGNLFYDFILLYKLIYLFYLAYDSLVLADMKFLSFLAEELDQLGELLASLGAVEMEEGRAFHELAAFEDAEGLLLGFAVLEDKVGFILVYACA